MPLAVGNWWEYVESTFIDNSVIVGNTKKGISGWRDIDFGDTTYTVFEYSSYYPGTDEPVGPVWFYTNDAVWGLRCLGGADNDETFIVDNLQVKFPATEDESWETMLLIYSGSFAIWDTVYAECIDVDRVFNTPAGDFETFVYVYE